MGEQETRGPLVLVVENEEKWAAAIHQALVPLGVQTKCVGNQRDGWKFMSEHGADSAKLVVLDIRIPMDEGKAVEDNGGIKLLRILTTYKFLAPMVPVVVYTAFPNYEQCVECMRAGAFWYLAKSTEEKRSEELIDVCRAALKGHRPKQSLPPEQWLQEHGGELTEEFGNQHIVLINEDMAQSEAKEELAGCTFLGGYAVLARQEYEDLRTVIVESDALRALLPAIVYIPQLG